MDEINKTIEQPEATVTENVGRKTKGKDAQTHIGETPNVSAETVKKPSGNAPADKRAYMYLGPNLPGGLLFRGSVFKAWPEHLAYLFEQIHEIKDLFIEVKDVPEFKRNVEEQGSEAYRLYQNVEILIGEGALKNVL